MRWLDGASYVGTVLETSEAVAKVRPVGYPQEYQLWITKGDIAEEVSKKPQSGSMSINFYGNKSNNS